MLFGEFIGQYFLLIVENLEVLFGANQLVVKVLALLFSFQNLCLLIFDDLFKLCLGHHHDVIIILLTVQLSGKPINRGTRRLALARCLDIGFLEFLKLLKEFVLFLRESLDVESLVSLFFSHSLQLFLKHLNSVFVETKLISHRALVVAQLVHGLRRHFGISLEISDSTLNHVVLFFKLEVSIFGGLELECYLSKFILLVGILSLQEFKFFTECAAIAVEGTLHRFFAFQVLFHLAVLSLKGMESIFCILKVSSQMLLFLVVLELAGEAHSFLRIAQVLDYSFHFAVVFLKVSELTAELLDLLRNASARNIWSVHIPNDLRDRF